MAAASPLPIVVYNFPGVCNGVDLDSDAIAALARAHANVVGVKLTCGSVAKVTRLTAEFPPEPLRRLRWPGRLPPRRSQRWRRRLYRRLRQRFSQDGRPCLRPVEAGEDTVEPLSCTARPPLAERPCKSGIAMTKYAAAVYTAGNSAAADIQDAVDKMRPRRPYLEPSDADKEKCRAIMANVAAIEETL